MDLQQLMKDSRRIANDHGFSSKDISFGDAMALLHTEISEAFEEYRQPGCNIRRIYTVGTSPKPEGVPAELADVVIRICQLCEEEGIPLIEAIKAKQAYNETRPFKHGKRL